MIKYKQVVGQDTFFYDVRPQIFGIDMREYTKVDDNQNQEVYDLDIIELTHTIKGRHQKGEQYIVFYDFVHNRFGACFEEDYGAQNTGFRSHFFITPANALKFKVVGYLEEKTKNRSYA